MMLRQVTVAVAVVALAMFAVPAVRAAAQSSQGQYAPEKQESTGEKLERATKNTAEEAKEKAKDAAHKTSKELSDSWITLKTKLSLLGDERVSSRDIHVATRQSVVALRGTVASNEARRAAEEDVNKIEGVTGVKNHLVVSKAAAKAVERQDDEIVSDVEARIQKDRGLKTADIDVRAEHGIVTLTGKAPSLRTSAHASEVASRVSGVRAVHNELAVENPQG